MILSKKVFFLIIVFCLYFLAGCSLRPIYGNNNSTHATLPLQFIELAPIDSVDGAELIYHLANLLPASSSPKKYLLRINLNYSVTPAAIQKNSDVLRQTLTQSVTYQLYNDNNTILTQGKFTQMNSYSTTFAPYASFVESEEAAKNLSKQAAEDIRMRLVLYFSKHPEL